jgi:uncharacterized protein with HEPN domain
MLEAASDAVDFASARQRSDLDQDKMLALALVKAIEIIGEAASRVSQEGRAAHPAIPWSAIVAMRNRLIHGYFSIDHDVVWSTVTEELPPLIRKLQALLADEDANGRSS